jgi:hypothetical protein
MTTRKDNDTTCSACGQLIKPGNAMRQVATGTLGNDGEFVETSRDRMHDACFGKSIKDPRAVLADIKRIAAERKPRP